MKKLSDFYHYLEEKRLIHQEQWHKTGDSHHLMRYLEVDHVLEEFKATIKAMELEL